MLAFPGTERSRRRCCALYYGLIVCSQGELSKMRIRTHLILKQSVPHIQSEIMPSDHESNGAIVS